MSGLASASPLIAAAIEAPQSIMEDWLNAFLHAWVGCALASLRRNVLHPDLALCGHRLLLHQIGSAAQACDRQTGRGDLLV